MIDWPPVYTVRKSKRAKRASIRVNLHRHIEVVVPERARGLDPLALLNEHKSWVIKQITTTAQAPVKPVPLCEDPHAFLLSLLQELSELHQLPFKELQVRKMKTRWGSCRRDGKITLNSLLIYLPIHLIKHVILHELCHTKYMSHGPRFWGLLSKLDPLTMIHDKALRQVGHYLPEPVES